MQSNEEDGNSEMRPGYDCFLVGDILQEFMCGVWGQQRTITSIITPLRRIVKEVNFLLVIV